MSELLKLKIVGYTESTYSEGTKNGEFSAQINPSSIKIIKKIAFQEDQELGKAKKKAKYKSHDADNISFDIILDDTGVVPSTKGKIRDRINQLEKTIYQINSESHEPNYAKVIWGIIIFKGRAASFTYDYTLFSPSGVPLRVKISLSFTGHFDKDTSTKNSPDLSRVITFRAGDTIINYCHEIYGDSSYCRDVASYNNFESFRNVEPGTKVMFPPLARK